MKKLFSSFTKKISVLIVVFSLMTIPVRAQNSLCYDLVSFTESNSSANTPLFNLAIFNKKCFEIQYTNYSNGFQFLFDLIIGASIATAIILFTIGAAKGIINVNNVQGRKESDEIMYNAIIGLMIVLSMWMLVNTLNPDLLRLPIFQNLEDLAKNRGGGPSGGSGVTAK